MQPFRVDLPSGTEIPVIVEVPHASVRLDPESLGLCVAPARSIGRDADLFVDELFEGVNETGATVLTANLSRYVCDLNRDESELDSHTTPGGLAPSAPHGVVWRRTTEGRPALAAPLTQAEIERRLDLVHRPYHRTLTRLIEEKRARFGHVVVLCAHSMPSFGRLGEKRADVVPGTRGRTTADGPWIDVVERTSLDHGFAFAHDTPYRGGFTTGRHGVPTCGTHAIQIELARRIYMNETTLSKNSGFESARRFCRRLVEELGAVRPRV